MIGQLAKALTAVGIDLDWRDLADIMWLSHATGPVPPRLMNDRHSPGDRERASGSSAMAEKFEIPGPAGDTSRSRATLQRGGGQGLDLDIRIPSRTALPAGLEIGRALRPFKHARLSVRERVFDTDATIDHYCATKVLAPITVPEKTRWFEDVALVVDGGLTMAPWQETVTMFADLLERHGAFDRITRWTLVGDGNGIHVESVSGLRHDAHKLVDYRGRRLILVITDGVSALWRGPAVWSALRDWGCLSPVALVQTLPARLWPATAIGAGDVVVRSDQRGEANMHLRLRPPWWWDEERPPEHATPIVTLDEVRLGHWARMVMGTGGDEVAGVVTRPPGPAPVGARAEPADAHERVDTFRATVSEEAISLAVLLSAIEVSLPVARLILDSLIPNGRQTYLAEVLAGGLLQRGSLSDDSTGVDTYDFVPGVREILQESLTTTAVIDVWQTVAPYLEVATGQRAPFSSLLSSGASTSDGAPSALERITADLINRLGMSSMLPVIEPAPVTTAQPLSVAQPASDRSDTGAFTREPGKVLLVENENEWLEVMRRALTEYRIHSARTYDQAIRLIDQEEPYDVAIVELNLLGGQDMLGADFLDLLRERHPSTARIAITGSPPPGPIRQVFDRYHIDELLIKSHLQVPDLRRVVEEALELRKPTTGSGKADALGGATAEVYEGLGSEERRDFDALDDYRKVAVARVLAELQHKVRDVAWDAETDRRIHSALASFTRECVSSSNQGSFTSAVIEMTTLVEGLAKQLISRLTNAVYGGDPARIRRELNLPTSKFRNLTLGMTVQALRSASSHPEFTEYADLLTNQWIQRLESFTDSRNRWAHDDIHLQGLELLDEVHRVFAEALDLVIWLSRSAESVRQQPAEQEDDGLRDTIELRLSDRHDQRFSVFVSHAAEDAQIASRLAIGLQALGYDTWFDEWELLAGDSIIERVEAAITVTDVLLVLLSASSVSSRWMRRELSAGLVRQLAGKGVLVIPVLVENCEIPGLLADVELVDLSDNFEQGFLWLVEALTARRGQIMGSQ